MARMTTGDWIVKDYGRGDKQGHRGEWSRTRLAAHVALREARALAAKRGRVMFVVHSSGEGPSAMCGPTGRCVLDAATRELAAAHRLLR